MRAVGGRIAYVASGRVRTDSRLPLGRRLAKIFTELQRVVSEYGVTACAVESGYVGRSAQSSLQLGQARAAALLAVEMQGVSADSVTPREIKMAITGRGSAAKDQVAYMVGKMLRLEFEKGEQDISDALAAALCRLLHSNRAAQARAAS